MTHSLFRPGDPQLGDDWVVIARAARGINEAGARERLLTFLETARAAGAVNWGHGRGGARLNSDWVSMTDRLADLSTVTVVFDKTDTLERFLDTLHDLALGLSITVSGDMTRIDMLCRQRGWKPHSGRQAIGIFGGAQRLPRDELLQLTAQCGHGLVAPALVDSMVERLRTGAVSFEQASALIGKPCVCGLINPSRTEAMLRRLVEEADESRR